VPPSYYKIKLTTDVALVLCEWLEQREDSDWEGVPVAHPGELAALSQFGGALEKSLPELFSPLYSDLVPDARRLAAAHTPKED
jgi:hypothetical protein